MAKCTTCQKGQRLKHYETVCQSANKFRPHLAAVWIVVHTGHSYLWCQLFSLRLKEVIYISVANLLESILLNIMFCAPMGRFQLEIIYCFTFICHRPSIYQSYVPVL